jgi:hypothetical protein
MQCAFRYPNHIPSIGTKRLSVNFTLEVAFGDDVYFAEA